MQRVGTAVQLMLNPVQRFGALGQAQVGGVVRQRFARGLGRLFGLLPAGQGLAFALAGLGQAAGARSNGLMRLAQGLVGRGLLPFVGDALGAVFKCCGVLAQGVQPGADLGQALVDFRQTPFARRLAGRVADVAGRVHHRRASQAGQAETAVGADPGFGRRAVLGATGDAVQQGGHHCG